MTVHPIPPVFDENSRILLLGSFPSVKSRETAFFYGHKQNRFWKVISAVFDSSEPQTIPEKKAFLIKNGIALWDVIASCDIEGSADNTIKNVTPNDLSLILNNAKIERIFVNGGTAARFYKRYIEPAIGISAITLPSTSPANAAWSAERLTNYWKNKIKEI
jgi:hypoxanthine-DNA glycosylase